MQLEELVGRSRQLKEKMPKGSRYFSELIGKRV